MSGNHEAVMKKYGVKIEESHTYLYKGYRYRNLSDAVNYAIVQEEKQEVDSADNTQVPRRGDTNAFAE